MLWLQIDFKLCLCVSFFCSVFLLSVWVCVWGMGFTVYERDLMRSSMAFLLLPLRANKISSAHICRGQGRGYTEHPLTELLVTAL